MPRESVPVTAGVLARCPADHEKSVPEAVANGELRPLRDPPGDNL